MSKVFKNSPQQSKLILEELEERRLFSGGIEGLIVSDLDPEAQAIYADADKSRTANADDETSASAAEQQSQEVVFVDAGVDNYQELVDDLHDNADSNRNIEVVVLDQDTDGIEEISEFLSHRDGLDAIHIISHGDDGSIQLGNTNLDNETLQDNNLKIALWANSFTESGDILIYGCNLAETEAGQALINDISSLTLADVAASTDLTGSAILGGDWDLEHEAGSIEASVAVSVDTQQQWSGLLAETVHTSYETTTGTIEPKSDTNYGQTFTYTSGNGNYNVNQLSLLLSKEADATLQDITVSLRTSWNGADLASATISSSELSTSMTWENFDIGNVSLTDGASYVIRVSSDSTDGKIWLGDDPSGTYANGDKLDADGSSLGGEDLAFRVTQTTPPNTAPTDLVATSTTNSGVTLNADGGNDVYFVADDGGGLLGGLTTVTIEASFAITSPVITYAPILSYADGSNDEELAILLEADGTIRFGASSNGSVLQDTTGTYTQLFDGNVHHVGVSWDSATGVVDFYVDGALVESFSGYQTGQTITGSGELVFGQEQDSVLGNFSTSEVFSGTLYDIRIFDDVRTAGEIGANYDQTLPSSETGMIANWVFDDLSLNGVITDTVSGNNLTQQHVVGAGFSTSVAELNLQTFENAANGTVVGNLATIDPDSGDSFTYTLQDDAGGRFAINAANGEITVANGSLLDFETASSHDITVRTTDTGGLTYDEVFAITVTNVNDAPLNSVPGSQTTAEDTPLEFSTMNSNAISIGDPDGAAVLAEVTLAVDNGSLSLAIDSNIAVNGGETRVNTTTTDAQSSPEIAINNSGMRVVVWDSLNQDGSSYGVYAQIYDVNGTAIGGEILVNSETSAGQFEPSVAIDDNGSFVVVWTSENQDDGSSKGVFGQRFDADGNKLGGEFLINQTIAGDQENPEIAMDAAGNFTVVWNGNGSQDVFMRRYDTNGQALTGEVSIADNTANLQSHPQIAMNAAGNFVVTWNSDHASASDINISGQLFDASGAAIGSEFQANTSASADQRYSSVAMDETGNFVIVWEDTGGADGDQWGVLGQLYDAAGNTQGSEFIVSSNISGFQYRPSVAMNSSGFVVSWAEPDSDNYGIYTREFDAAGNAIDTAFQVNTTTSGVQQNASLAVNQYGDLSLVWSGPGTGDSAGVFMQRYTQGGGIYFSAGDGTDDSTMTFGGTLADINAALDGLTYTPDLNYSGSDTLTITTNDLGNIGGGALQDVDTVAITVSAVNDAPTAVVDVFVVNEDTPTNLDPLANDSDPENDTLTLLGFERVVASYDAGTTGSAVDPASVAGGSWFFEDTEDANAATGNLQSSEVSPDGATGQNAWNLVDGSDNFGDNLWYSTTLSGADATLAGSNGWSLSSEIRLVDDFDDTRTTFIRYGDGTNRFLAYFDLDANDDLTVELIDDGGNQLITLTDDGNGSADYHHYEIVYDPGTSTAMFLFDGVRVDGGGWSGEASANVGVRWGMGSGGGQASANYHALEMKVFDQSITTANGATVTNNGDGTVNYAPTQNYVGNDSFSYTMRDSEGHVVSAGVDVNVVGVADGIRVTPLSLAPIGGETLVNTTAANNQFISSGVSQAMATDANGNYIVVWHSDLQDGSDRGIYAQLYNANGSANGVEFLVNTTTSEAQISPSVAMDDAGNFTIAWMSNLQDGDNYGVYAQQFNAAGVAQGSEFLVNTMTAGYQGSPGIAMAANGAFVINWTSGGQDPDGSIGIYAQLFDAGANTVGSEFRANTYTTGHQQVSSVSMDDAGNFIMTWGSQGQDGSNYGVFGQIFNADGNPRGNEFQVNTTTNLSQLYNDVVMLPDGRFVVVYQSSNPDTSADLFIQAFNADGSMHGGEIKVNAASDMDYFPIPSITADASGNFTVVWNNSNDGTLSGVFMRSYDWDGNALTGEVQVNTTTAGDQLYPDIVAQPDGSLIVAWSGNGTGDADGIFTQRYGLQTQEGGTGASFQLVLESAPTDDVVIPISVSDGSEGSVSVGSVTFTSGDWNIAQTVNITSIDDLVYDGTQTYTINIGPATSADTNFDGLDPENLTVTNLDFVNTAPQITSDGGLAAATINLDEGSKTVTAVTASDVDVETLTYSITDGADQGLFSIDGASGVLTFNTPPNYEGPGDNNYQVEVTVADQHGGSDVQLITVNVANLDPIANGAWFDETDGGSGYADFASLAAAHNTYLGTTEQTIDFESLTQGDVLSNQFTVSHGVTFSNTGINESQIYAEGGPWIQDVSGYDGSYAADGSNVYLKMANDDPAAPFTIEFATPVSKVGAMLGMGKEGTDHSLQVRLYDSGGNLLDERSLEAELWEASDTFQNYETFLGVSYDSAVISKIEILNPANIDYGNALIVDQLQFSTTPDVFDEFSASTAIATVTGNVLSNDIDPAGGALSITGFSQGANGSVVYNNDGTFTYTSNASFTGTDTFTYTISDGQGGSDTATVTMQVSNAAPDITSDGGLASAAVNVAENTSAVTTVTANDSDGHTPTFSITGGADQALFTILPTGELSFVASPDYEGPGDNSYVVEVTVSDGHGGTDVQTITVNVTDVNENPLATDDPGIYLTELQDLNPLSYWRLGETGAGAADLGSSVNAGTYSGGSQNQGGGISGDSDAAVHFDGSEYVEITHSNDYLLDDGTIQLWFNADGAVSGDLQHLFSKDSNGFGNGGHVSMYLNTSGQLEVRLQSATTDYIVSSSAAVSDGDWHHAAFSFGTNGMALYLDGQLVDSDAYTGGLGTTSGGSGNAEDIAIAGGTQNSGSPSVGTVNQLLSGLVDEVAIVGGQLDAQAIQQLYDAGSNQFTVYENATLSLDAGSGVLANDSDVDGDSLVVAEVNGNAVNVGSQISLASGALLTVNADGSVDYDPNGQFEQLDAGETATDTFNYTLSDGQGGSDTATVTVTVVGEEDAPTLDNAIADQSATEDVAFNFTFNGNVFGDVDTSDTLTYSATLADDSPLPAWLSFDGATRTFSGTPLNADVGAIDIKITADDGDSMVIDTFTLTVNNANDAPVANVDSAHLVFDGGDIVQVADDASLQMSNNLTMEAWFNYSSSATGSQLVLNKEGEYEFGVNADTGELQFAIAQSDNTWNWHQTGYFVNADEWVHAAITYDGVAGEAKTYVNGELVDTYLQSGNIGDVYTAYDDLFIGGRQNDADERFNGLIDDVRIWDTTRSAVEIGSSYNDVLSGGESGLAGYWRLDDADGNLVSDLTGNSNDGTLGGAEGVASTPTYDGYYTDQDTPLVILAADGVLANDFDADGDSLTVTNLDTTGMLGTLNLNPADGSFSYDPNGAFDYLDVGEVAYETFTYSANDGNLDSNVVSVTITVVGNEDAAVTGGTTSGIVAEDGTLSASETLTITDVDTSDNPVGYNDVTATLGDSGFGNFEISSNTWTYTLDNDHAAVQALDVGETLTDTHTFTASDGSTQQVTITINGAEDAPVFDSTAVTAATEDVAYSYTITTSDVDIESVTITAPTLPAWLTFVDNGDGTATLSGTPTNAEVGSHNVVLNVSDGSLSSNQNFTIVVANTNDPAVIGGADTGAVQEDVAVVANNISTSGTLTISDPDTGESTFQAATINGAYGDLTIDTAGNWTYTADNTQAAIQQLDALESMTDTLTITSFDGTTHNVVITINGSEDVAVIGGTTVGSVTEDGTLTSSGTLTISDTDTSDSPSFADVTSTAGDNGYGSFVMTSGTWTYTLDNNNTAVQALGAGDSLDDTYTFLASDGSSQQVTVTINGSEDVPVVITNNPLSVPEESTRTITTAYLESSDADNTPAEIVYTLTVLPGGDGSVRLSGSTLGLGSTFTQQDIDNNLVTFRFGDDSAITSFKFTVTDGATTTAEQTFSVNGAPINDAPVNTLPTSITVTEETPTALSGFSIIDIDAAGSDLTTRLQVSAGTLNVTLSGGATISAGSNGSGDLTIRGTVAEINATLVSLGYTGNTNVVGVAADTLTMTTDDGGNTGSGGVLQDIDTVQIDITNTNDPAVIGGTDTGAVQEDVAVVSDDISTSGTLTITDPDIGESSFQAATINGTYGDLAIDTAGNWSYTADNTQAAIQQLDALESITDTLTVTSFDGTTHNVVITINGSEDAAVIGGTTTGSVQEDGTLTSSGLLTISDTDTSDTPGFADVPSTAGDNGYGNFVMTSGTWTYALDNNNAAVQALDVGETLSDTHTFTATDGSTQQVTITINGAEDAPVFDSTAITAATEDVIYSYTITTSDVDIESVTITAPTLPAWLTFVDNGDGTATLSGTPTNAEVGSHNVVLTVSDGTLSGNQNFTIVVTNTNDPAVIGGADTGTVQEDVAVAANNISTSGTLTITDPDTGESSFQAATINGTYGDLVMQTNGNWIYTADNTQAAIQQLDTLESITDTLTVTSFDGTTHNVVITINGSEDASVISGTTTGSVTEDGTLTSSGTLTITDTDSSDSTSFVDVTSTAGDNGYGSFVMTSGTWTYTLDNNNTSVQALDVGETLTDTHTFTAPDGVTQLVTVTINGAEDAPVFDSTAITAATEDAAYSYTITTSDVDIESVTIIAPTLPAWLTFVDNGDGTATLSGTPTNAEVGSHNVVLTVSDGTLSSNQNFTIVVANTNDPAVIGGADTGAVQEDVAVVANNISTSGTLTISDPDAGEQIFQTGTINGTYGDLVMQINGDWTYTADNTQAAIQQLDASESMTDTLTVTSFDGTTHNVVITINGSEDAAVIGGSTSGSVTEDGTQTSSGTLTISDTDTSDTPGFADVGATAGDNGYGSFVMTSGTWTYTLDNNNAAVQALDAGETLSDTHTFTATDGSTQQVTITINGAEDAPVFDSTAITAATEDVAYGYTITTSDVDIESVTITAPTLPAWLTFVDNGDGTATLNGTPTNAEVGSHNVVLNVSDGTLSSNQNFTIVVGNTNDPAVIGGADTGAVQEDVAVVANNISASGSLTVADPDVGESSFVAATINGAYGDLVIDSAGNWSYSADNSQISIQALDALESITDTLTVTTFDGTTHNVVITINGSEDAAVTGGTASGSVTEDGGLTATDALTIADVDASDNPVNYLDVAPTPGANGYGNFEITGNTWTYTLTNGHAAVQALDVGETLTDTYTFLASDGSSQLVTVTINGAEDAPTLDNAIGDQTATEDLAFNFTFADNTFGDLDTSDTLIYSATLADSSPLPGWLNFDAATRTFSGTPANADVGSIDIRITASDGSSTIADTFTLTVLNVDDAPLIGGDDTGTITEDVGVIGGVISTTGSLTITDPDAGESSFQPETVNGSYGDLTIDISGNWIYDANNNQASIQALDAGQSIIDTLTVSAFDGTTHDIVITINGAEDSAVIGGTAVGAVTEDSALVVSDTLMITDVDSNDNPISFNDVAPATGSNGYGNFEMTGNTWNYTLNNSHASVQALDVGETLTDTYTFSASDGSTQVVTVTINGSEDAPVIGGTATGAVSEDGALAASDTLTITDTDSSDNPISFNDVTPTPGINGYGSFEMSGNTWTYTLNNSHASVQALDVGETLTDLFTFSASDGSTRIVTVTIGGAEDAPTLDNAIADQTATEDVAFNFTFAINTFGDLDTSDTLIYSATLADSSPLPGWLNFDAATRTFSGTPANTDVGQIDIRITADDGSSTVTDTLTLTVQNVNDSPLIGGVDSGQVNEDQSVSGGKISTSGVLTIADPDVGESSFVGSTIKGALGGLTIDTAGNWSYSADNDNPEIQALQSGESITDTMAVTTADGSTHNVVITINGAADASRSAPPPVQPPPVEPPPEEEPPPADEKAEEDVAGEDPIVDEIVRAPQNVTPPPVQTEVDSSSYLQQEEAEADRARVSQEKVKYAAKIIEQPQPLAIQQQAIQQQNINLSDLRLQVSDDEALNEKFELELLARIDSMHSGMDDDAAQTSADDVEVQIVMGSTASLTAGIVSWVLRGGSLLASFMSTVPLLNRFDPLPILKSREEEEDVEEDSDDDDTDTRFRQHQKRVDNLFSQKDGAREHNGHMNE